MLLPNDDVLRAILNLKRSNPESFEKITMWMKESVIAQGLAIADIEGDERTHVAKGGLKVMKTIDLFFSNIERVIESRDKAAAQAQNNTTDMLS